MNIFNEVDKFFSSLKNYLNYNIIFIIFVSLFLLTVFFVIISTSRAYEARLIKAIDMFNNYFIDNPQITEENLVPFNNKMKSRKVPKQLRKQWQQFVLYRENKASYYMSFEICVSTPIKNSTYKRDITVMNILTYIYVFACILLNLYFSYEFSQDLDLILVLQRVLLCPIIILVLNYIITIFLDLRHNAIVSDLYQNYQYFEVNIDKATQTLPEYVDYEVLFDRNEIKKGIPTLYAYLQKRAEEEKRELERARLKNVEHEKFNFDESGVESSLVLERAMQEAENYIAERKKYMQDMEQINSDITQEEMNFRETTKEYQRQMQVSKESFDNFKSQLEEVSSTIEANYLKKQMQQELDHQRNLERDYDTKTDSHKKLLENYQTELTSVENSVKGARRTLEKGMMSEFDTYSNKVYDAAMKAVEDREKEAKDKLKQEIKTLEETIVSKNKELDNIYNQNQILSEKLEQLNAQLQNLQYQNQQPTQQTEQQSYIQPEQIIENQQTMNYSNSDSEYNNQNVESNEQYYSQNENSQIENQIDENNPEQVNVEENNQAVETNDQIKNMNDDIQGEDNIVRSENVFTIQDNESNEKKKAGRPRKNNVETDEEPKEKKKRGRPKKVVSVEMQEKPTRKVGRPKKNIQSENEKSELTTSEPKRRGRPRKIQETAVQNNETLKETSKEIKSSKRGRPRKVITSDINSNSSDLAKKRGRPRKEKIESDEIKEEKKRGRPKKVVSAEIQDKSARKVGRPKKNIQSENSKLESANSEPKRRGRPRKIDSLQTQEPKLNDIDAYLKEIDDQIAKENAKIEESKKELEKNSRINKKK